MSRRTDRDGPVVAERPDARHAAAVRLPAVRRGDRSRTACASLVVDLPGRPLCQRVARPAQRRGRRAGRRSAGATVLAARALTEGTERYDAIELPRPPSGSAPRSTPRPAGTRLTISVDVPADRLEAALELLAEVAPPPDVPGRRGRAPARRAPQRPAPGQGRPAPARRGGVRRDDLRAGARRIAGPSGGTRETVERLDADRAPSRRTSAASTRRGRRSSSAATSAASDVVGDRRAAVRRLGTASRAPRRPRTIDDASAVDERFVRVVHRPGSVQTEIRDRPPRRCRAGSRTSTRSR